MLLLTRSPPLLPSQVHNWANRFDDPTAVSYEYVAPTTSYAVVNGQRMELELVPKPAVAATASVEEPAVQRGADLFTAIKVRRCPWGGHRRPFAGGLHA